MTPDELRALADDLEVRPPNQHDVMATWARRKVESAARLRLLEVGASLARDHAALLDTIAEVRRLVSLHEMARSDEMGFTDDETVGRIADVLLAGVTNPSTEAAA